MNREAAPLIIAVCVPVILIVIILLYFYCYDVTTLLKKIDVIYYIMSVPFGLGLLAAFFHWKRK